jgi:hypothetical protein
MALRLIVDRDSVAAGDDTESHLKELQWPDDSTLGDLLAWILDGFLASVAGPVGWKMHLAHEAEVHGEGSSRWIDSTTGTRQELATIFVTPPRREDDGRWERSENDVRYALTDRSRMIGWQTRIADAVRPTVQGERVVVLDYLSRAGLHVWNRAH